MVFSWRHFRERATAVLDRAETTLGRQQTLAKSAAISGDELDAAVASAKAARSVLAAATFAVQRAERELQLATGGGATFVNDVVATKRAAWFTDSNRAVLYRLPLSKDGRPAAAAQAVQLTGDFVLGAGFNLITLDELRAVDEPGENRFAFDVDDSRSARYAEFAAFSNGLDALAFDYNDGIIERCPAGAVDQRAALDNQRSR